MRESRLIVRPRFRRLARCSKLSAMLPALVFYSVMAFIPVLLLVSAGASRALAQLPQTRLYAFAPLGGKAGTTFDVKVTNGEDLDELDALVFNHPGIKAVPKMQESGGKQVPVTNTFVVTIAPDVPPGAYEVRANGLFGLSNPRSFAVGDRNEINETDDNNTPETAQQIEQNVVVNGTMGGATDIDCFRIEGKKGQRILVTCRAAQTDSQMMATLEIYDPSNHRLDYSRGDVDDLDDPLLDVTLPADGPYLIKVYDFLYRGGADYGYRLLAGVTPYIDFVMPPAGLPGTTSTYTLYGRNLPGGQDAGVAIDGRPLQKLNVSIALPQDESTLDTSVLMSSIEASVDAVSYVHRTPSGSSNAVQVYLATAPVVIEQEPNDEPAQAHKVTVPAEIGGQFQAARDSDTFQFEAKAGEVYYIEAFGQRNGGLSDPYFTLSQVTTNDKGEEQVKQLAAEDDTKTNLAPNVFDTLTDDPVYRFQVPADGTYRVMIRDRYFEVRGNPKLTYRLSIRRESPDFRVVVVPTFPSQNKTLVSQTWAVVLRKGDSVKVDLLAFRQDGFDGSIDVTVEGLPPGVECKGTTIGSGQTSSVLVFTSAEDAPEWAGHVKIIAKASVGDPVKERAIATAEALVKTTTEALPKLQEALTKATDASNKSAEAATKAQEALKAKPDDAGLKAKADAAQKAAAAAAAAAKKATDAKQAGDKALADAQAAVQKAEADYKASHHEVVRPARAGTIAWKGANNVAGMARLAQALGLSVLKEPAPYQVTTNVFRVEANQSRQILVPVKLHKRNGFDNNVQLTFIGLPDKTNIQLTGKPIAKGKDEELLRIFLPGNAVPGTYTVYLKAQGQVSYSRNPERAERAKAEQAQANEALKQAQEAAKKAVAAQTEANKKAEADAQALKKAQAAQAAVEKQVADANAAVKKATDAKAAADKGTDDAAKQAAAKALTDVQAAAKKAADDLTAAKKAATDAAAAAKASAEAKTKAEAAAKAADAKSKAADAAKKAADKRATDAANAAKPKNINCYFSSTPIVVEVKPGPATLAASVPGGGSLKKGGKIDVKVTVKRINEFAGPVTLTLPAVPGVKGVTAQPVTIPADQTEGVLSIQAAGDATEGQLAHLVIRGTMDFNGKAAVDVPVTIKVAK